jgi:PAS domain S-box-containing protein
MALHAGQGLRTTMKDNLKTKSQLLAEMEALREELRRHAIAETDAASAEESMWQTQLALVELFNNLPGMAYRTAFDAKAPLGRVEFVSGGCLRLTGYPAAVYVTTPTLYRQQIIHPDDRQRVREAIAQAEARHEPFTFTYRIVTKDKQVRWMEEHGSGMYGPQGEAIAREGFITDVTERMAHLEELGRQHTELEKLTRAVEQAGELILIGDASGVVQYVNQAFEEMTGFRRAEVIGRPLHMASTDRRERSLFHRILLTLQRGDVWRGRYVSRRKDGTLFELECTASPVISPDGHFEGYVAVQRDASDECHATFDDRLTQRLEVLGLVAGSFIREFNNQLEAIHGHGQLAAAAAAIPDGVQGHLQAILAAAAGAREAGAEFLSFLTSPDDDLRPVSFRKVAEKALRLLRSALPAGIEIRERLTDEPLPVRGNPTHLLTAVISLAVNAARPIWQRGGVLALTLARHPAPGAPPEAAGAAESPRVECRIASCLVAGGSAAAGVAEGRTVQPSVFGLTVLREVVQQHGGTISAADDIPGGTAAGFVLRLPLMEPAASGPARRRPPAL